MNRSDPQGEFERLLSQAQSQPGVAEVMRIMALNRQQTELVSHMNPLGAIDVVVSAGNGVNAPAFSRS